VRLTVAGQRQDHPDGPAIELIVCPSCQAMRRIVLPPNIVAPFRVVGPDDGVRRS
jgi:hypothetical protein